MAYSTIPKGSLYMNTKLYTGNGSTQSITGVGFQPDWTWLKNRSGSDNHFLTDVVRGVTKTLYSNDTYAEETQANGLTAFGSDGFSIGSASPINGNTENFVSWNWKAGTAVSGSTTGSGTAKTYTGSVSTTSGFSIINYIGNGTAGHTIPHNLNAVPKMIFVKNMVSAANWQVYNSGVGATKFLILNNTDSSSISPDRWNDTTPTSTVFTLGSDGDVNTNGTNYIAYCFADKIGYSKFDIYKGNGNADGPFIYTGFKPAFVMFKSAIDETKNWSIRDNKRDPFNASNTNLFANLDGGDSSSNDIDFLSNGIKLRNTGGSWNTNTATYIYMAFAENPFVATSGTNAIPVTAR